jgi:hypothetical protein
MKKIFEVCLTLISLLLLAGCAGKLIASPLILAAREGDNKAIIELLDSGGDVNEPASWPKPLVAAASFGHIDTVRLLLDRGADVNAPDAYGLSPLIGAALNAHADIARLLIESGADIDAAMAGIEIYGGERAKPGLALLERLAQQTSASGQSVIAKSASGRSYPSSPNSDIDEIPVITAEPRKSDFAVVIGIENYRSLPKSDYSGNDAALVTAYLKALGFPERNIDFISDARATKTDMEKSLEAWLPNQARKESTIFVYYSGHGAPEPATGEAYIVPYDGDPNYLTVTGYPLKRLYAQLGRLEAKEIIVVLDSCFSGSGGRSVLAKGARPLVMMAATETLPSNMAVLTATQGSQISTSSPEKGHGVFTYYFLKALKDGKRDLSEIYDTIKPQVEDAAKRLNVRQSPGLDPGAERIKGSFSLE